MTTVVLPESLESLTLIVDGQEVRVGAKAYLGFGGIADDLSTVSRSMGYIARLLGEARAEKVRTEARRRQWEAHETRKLLAANPKAAEWKVKADIRATATYLQMMDSEAEALRNETYIEGVFRALETKSRMLQSFSANRRTEAERGLDPVPADPPAAEPQPAPAPKVSPPVRRPAKSPVKTTPEPKGPPKRKKA